MIVVGLTVLYILWLLIKKSQWYSNRIEEEYPMDEYESNGVSYQAGCGGSYTLGSGINLDIPSDNLGMCGDEVKLFQETLNRLAMCNLAEDGKYGAQTKTCHQNLLDANFGTWSYGNVTEFSQIDEIILPQDA